MNALRNFVWAEIALCAILIAAAVYAPSLSEVLSLTRPDASGWMLVAISSIATAIYRSAHHRHDLQELGDGDFADLKVDDSVELVVQTGESEKGPQASTVRPIGSLQFVDRAKK